MQFQTGISFRVRFRKNKAEFLWSSTPERPIRGSVDLRVRVNPLELSWLARNLGCLVESEDVLVPSLDAYNRLLVYACVRPTIKDDEKAVNLALLVLDLNGWDAHYWASRFRELWWKFGLYRPLIRIVKAFKLFFGLD